MREDGSFTRRARLLGIGLLAVAVLVGALAGAALERVRVTQDATAAEVDRDRSEERKRGHILDEFELTPEQQARIDTILAQRRAQAEEIWSEVGPELRAISDSARSEIGAVLDEEQRIEYERFWEERRERYKNRNKEDKNR